MPAKNHYVVLGVSRDTSSAGIRSAYHELARRMHPDTAGPGDKSRFQEINESYEVLSDPDRRRAHDRDCGEPERVTKVPARHQPPSWPIAPEAISLSGQPGQTKPSFDAFRELSPQLHRLEYAQGRAGGKSDAGRGALAGGSVLRLHDPGWRAGVRCLFGVRRDRPSLPFPLSGVCRLGAFGGAARVVRPRAAPGPAWDGSGGAARNVRDQQSLSSGAGFDFGRAVSTRALVIELDQADAPNSSGAGRTTRSDVGRRAQRGRVVSRPVEVDGTSRD